MRSLGLLFTLSALPGLFHLPAAAENAFHTLGLSANVPEPLSAPPPDRGELLMHADGTYELGFQWCYGGVVPPDYGALAECYDGEYEVSAIVIDVASIGCQIVFPVDLYLWDDTGGRPGAVRCALVGFEYLLPGFWPEVHRNYIEIDPCRMPESWWVGVWGDWPQACSCWVFGVDETGPGGCPYTKIAPGQGLPEGWQPATTVPGLEEIRAFGLGALGTPGDPTPVRGSTWGRVKALYGS